jgi:hypothetical protein
MEFDDVAADEPRVQEHFPAATPVHSRWRALEPHGIAVGDAEGREERCEGITDQRRIEPLGAARTIVNSRPQAVAVAFSRAMGVITLP